MLILSTIRMLLAILGILILPTNKELFVNDSLKAKERSRMYISTTCLIIAFGIAVFQRTLFFPAQCLFYLFFFSMLVIWKAKKKFHKNYSMSLRKKLDKIYRPFYLICTSCFAILIIIAIYVSINKIADFDVIAKKITYSTESFDYESISSINFSNDGKTYFVSKNDFSSEFLKSINEDIVYKECISHLNSDNALSQQNKIKCLNVEVYHKFDNIEKEYYTLYNWFNIFLHKRYTFYVIG